MVEEQTTVAKGRAGEEEAAKRLEAAGYKIIERNYRPVVGGKIKAEIDIIAEDKDFLVFVEVKHFRTFGIDTLEYAIGPLKRKKIITGARYFLASHPKYNAHHIRFDVCFLSSNGFTHIKSAFEK